MESRISWTHRCRFVKLLIPVLIPLALLVSGSYFVEARAIGFSSSQQVQVGNSEESPEVGASAQNCQTFEFGTGVLQTYIYSDGRDWDFTVTDSLSAVIVETDSRLAASLPVTMHIEVRINDAVLASWNQQVISSTYTNYENSQAVSIQLQPGDKVTYFIQGGASMSTPAGAITGPNTVRLCDSATPKNRVVTSSADSGPGTLRQVMMDAQNGDTITFDPAVFPPDNPVSITLSSGPLPLITQGNLTIDGTGAGVILDGSELDSGSGFSITSDHNTIRGMQILNFPVNGIEISGGAKYNVIGGDSADERNVISGNDKDGVWLAGADTMQNTVSGNYIGTDSTGMSALPNNSSGINITDGAAYNVVGGETPGERNLISGNHANDNNVSELYDKGGISVRGGSHHNTVLGNYIGTDATGATALGNYLSAVVLSEGASHNVIGGNNASPGAACTGACNLISGSDDGAGVLIGGTGTISNVVRGNYIGTDDSGTAALENEIGVSVYGDAAQNIIGGSTPGERNVISGNKRDGIEINCNQNVVQGNYIGTDASGQSPLPNGSNGIQIGDYDATDATRDNIIGGSNGTPGGACTGECNLISAQ